MYLCNKININFENFRIVTERRIYVHGLLMKIYDPNGLMTDTRLGGKRDSNARTKTGKMGLIPFQSECHRFWSRMSILARALTPWFGAIFIPFSVIIKKPQSDIKTLKMARVTNLIFGAGRSVTNYSFKQNKSSGEKNPIKLLCSH